MLPDTPLETLWLAIGLLGQALFAGRFIWQWWVSERLGRSVVPVAFWHLSLVGGAILTVYAVYRQADTNAIGNTAAITVNVASIVGLPTSLIAKIAA